jgi:hypothetical protein
MKTDNPDNEGTDMTIPVAIMWASLAVSLLAILGIVYLLGKGLVFLFF